MAFLDFLFDYFQKYNHFNSKRNLFFKQTTYFLFIISLKFPRKLDTIYMMWNDTNEIRKDKIKSLNGENISEEYVNTLNLVDRNLVTSTFHSIRIPCSSNLFESVILLFCTYIHLYLVELSGTLFY